MKSFDYSRRVAVEYETDVLVAGGGPAGLCAAVAAARCGARTMLIEKNGFCGGMATAGLVAPFMTCYDSGGELMLIRGLFEEIVDRLVGRSGAIHPSLVETSSAFTSYITAGHIHVTPFKAETLKLVADELLAEAGVRVLYHTGFVDVDIEGGIITRAIIHKKSGFSAVEAKIYVDCTGDADIAAAAGVPYELGNRGKMQPATMFFRVANVDSSKIDEDIEKNRDKFRRVNGVNYRSLHWWVSKAREAGDWTLDRVSIGLFRGVDEDEWSINTSRIMDIDGTDSEGLTRAEIIGRRQVDEIFRFLKKYVPGCENARLVASGSTVGIRETRHIEGIRKLSVEDIQNCRVPDDSILLAANSVDVHGKFGPMSNEYITIPPGKYYGVPYGCLVPVGIRNLLVAGRSISADSDAAGAIRVMPPCMGLGQAAGVAAALCAESRTEPAGCDIQGLRRRLIEQKVFLQ